MTLTRRTLLTRTAAGAGIYVAGNLSGLFANGPTSLAAASSPGAGGYGDLLADPDGLLDLPPGFSYRIVSTEGDPLAAGGTVPGRFDGTAAFEGRRRSSVLVRNHEQSTGGTKPTASADLTYDPAAFGGTSTLTVDADLDRVDEYVSLAGTNNNCAGGRTPWDTWLTCEETESKAGSNGMTKDHGWVFEVDPFEPANNLDPTPLTGLGRFAHEATMTDHRTGIVYLTEDASNPNGLVYRFLPNNTRKHYGALRDGGLLQAMRATDGGTFVPDLSAYSAIGTQLSLGWVDVPDPSAASTPTRVQLPEVTRSRKFEGAWWDRDGYIVCSYARGASDGSVGTHDGQVWKLDAKRERLELVVHFGFTPDQDVDPDGPDNITVSPYGGLILAEDGEGVQYLRAVDGSGNVTALARNARDDAEFTGVTFARGEQVLFANLQSPGVTFAITGPWR